VREEMKKIMQRCTRAPETFLPLRLPIKGSASVLESEVTSKNGTPAPDEKKATKAKSTATAKRSNLAKEPSATAKDKKVEEKDASAAVAAPPNPEAAVQPGAPTDGTTDDNADASRPRRTTRKSVRISEV
jgi:hypothetical protein